MASRAFTVHYKSTNVRDIGCGQRLATRAMNLMGQLTPRLTGRLVKRRFFTPVKPALGDRARRFLAGGRRFQFRVHNKEIRGWQWGTGPGILFVHGWNGRGVQFYHFMQALLNGGYRIVTYDGPAHGESQGQTTHFFEVADTLKAFFRQRESDDIRVIVGHSLGASAIVNYLAGEQADLETVLLAPALQPGKLLCRAFDQHGVPARIYLNLIADLEHRYGYDLRRDSPHLLARQVATRVLIVHDREDRVAPFRESEQMAADRANFVLHPTAGLGHERLLRSPGIVALVQAYILERCGQKQPPEDRLKGGHHARH